MTITGSLTFAHDLGNLCRGKTCPWIWTFWLWVARTNISEDTIVPTLCFVQALFINFFHVGGIILLFSLAILMSSTCTEKNKPCFLSAHRHSQFGTFSCPRSGKMSFGLSSPQQSCKWVSVHISFKRNHWVFNVRPIFWPCVSWNTYPYIKTLWPRNSQQSGSVFHSYLGVRRYCVGCLSITVWKPCNDIHDFFLPSSATQTSLPLWREGSWRALPSLSSWRTSKRKPLMLSKCLCCSSWSRALSMCPIHEVIMNCPQKRICERTGNIIVDGTVACIMKEMHEVIMDSPEAPPVPAHMGNARRCACAHEGRPWGGHGLFPEAYFASAQEKWSLMCLWRAREGRPWGGHGLFPEAHFASAQEKWSLKCRFVHHGRWKSEVQCECFDGYADIASAACPSRSGSVPMASMTFFAVICDARLWPWLIRMRSPQSVAWPYGLGWGGRDLNKKESVKLWRSCSVWGRLCDQYL